MHQRTINQKTSSVGITSAILICASGLLVADPETVTSSFEFSDSGTFTVSAGDQSATFTGGTAKPVDNASLARSGSNAWHITEEGTATITFSNPPSAFELWMRDVSGTTQSLVEIFDTSGILLDAKVSSPAYERLSVARTGFESKVGRVEITTIGDAATVIDDVSATIDDAPVTSTITALLEEPISGEVHSGVGNLRGWAFAPGGIERVDIYIDGEFQFSAPYGGSRADVFETFPDAEGSASSGFSLAYGYSNLLPGEHTLVARVIANSGEQRDVSATFEVAGFDKIFIGPSDVVDLGIASFNASGDTFEIRNVEIADRLYDLMLQWRTAEQGFEIVEIQ